MYNEWVGVYSLMQVPVEVTGSNEYTDVVAGYWTRVLYKSRTHA